LNPPSFSLISLPSLPRTISAGFIVQFSNTYTKYIDHFHLLSLTPFFLPLPTGIHSCTGPVLPFYPSFFFKSILIFSQRFCLCTSHMCILYFYQFNPLLLTLSLSPCSSIIQQLTVHYVILSSYTDAMCFNIVHSLSFSFPLLPPLRQTGYLIILSLTSPLHIYEYTYIHILYTFYVNKKCLLLCRWDGAKSLEIRTCCDRNR
jgi:hypothetical protein